MLLIAHKCNPTPNCLHIKKINSHPTTGNSETYRFLGGAQFQLHRIENTHNDAYIRQRFKVLSHKRSPEINSQKLVWHLHSHCHLQHMTSILKSVSCLNNSYHSCSHHVHFPGNRKIKRDRAKGHLKFNQLSALTRESGKCGFISVYTATSININFSLVRKKSRMDTGK